MVKGSHVVVAEYDQVIRNPSTTMKLPSVIALRDYVKPPATVAFTRFNVYHIGLYVAVIRRQNARATGRRAFLAGGLRRRCKRCPQ